jgi:dTDP-4-dehydrorhamnose 3,5-epimerase
MIFRETKIAGAFVVESERHVDDRGSFARIWCSRELELAGFESRLAQVSLSSNRRRGTLRGMHYSVAPHAEAKVVRCVRGAVYDVLLDLRPGSATRGTWLSEVISADNGRALCVPEGVAHGFQTLEDDSDVLYAISEFYDPTLARGVRWNDPSFNIQWPDPDPILSTRDAEYPDHEPAPFPSTS